MVLRGRDSIRAVGGVVCAYIFMQHDGGWRRGGPWPAGSPPRQPAVIRGPDNRVASLTPRSGWAAGWGHAPCAGGCRLVSRCAGGDCRVSVSDLPVAAAAPPALQSHQLLPTAGAAGRGNLRPAARRAGGAERQTRPRWPCSIATPRGRQRPLLPGPFSGASADGASADGARRGPVVTPWAQHPAAADPAPPPPTYRGRRRISSSVADLDFSG